MSMRWPQGCSASTNTATGPCGSSARTAVSVDAFHLVKLGNDMLTEVRQRLTQEVHGRRRRSIDPVWANRRLLLRAGDALSDRVRDRLGTEFATDDATGKLQAAWLVLTQTENRAKNAN